MELHSAAFGHGEAAGGNDECALAAVGEHHPGVGVLPQ